MPPVQKTSVPEATRTDGKAEPASGNAESTSGKELPPVPDIASVERAVKQINTYLSNSQRALNFSIHEASGRTVIRVVNPETDEFIRQIPSAEVLRIAAEMRQKGLQVFDELV